MPDIEDAFRKTTAMALHSLSESQIDEFYTLLTTIETNLITYKSQSVVK